VESQTYFQLSDFADQIAELHMDLQQLRNLWCQTGKGSFAGKWGSHVNYKGNMPDEEWEKDWKK
jgi:hypothetical protein